MVREYKNEPRIKIFKVLTVFRRFRIRSIVEISWKWRRTFSFVKLDTFGSAERFYSFQECSCIMEVAHNLISTETSDRPLEVNSLVRTRHTVKTFLYTPIKELLPYWSTVVCQELRSFMTWKIYVRKCVHRILCGELPEGSWLMCDAVRATEYNDSWALIRLYGDPRWKGHVNTENCLGYPVGWKKKLPHMWIIVSQQSNKCIVYKCDESCLCPINVFSFVCLCWIWGSHSGGYKYLFYLRRFNAV
jgi:hypothetical protein